MEERRILSTSMGSLGLFREFLLLSQEMLIKTEMKILLLERMAELAKHI
jgi:hypothetical protein